jgi:hypothetical protein
MFAVGFGGWYATGRSYVPRTAAPVAAPAAVASPVEPVPAAPAPSSVAGGPIVASPAAAGTAARSVLTTKSSKTGTLPDTLNRDDVRAVLGPLQAAFVECARGRSGVAQLDLNISNSGRATQVNVAGDFAGSPEAACFARVVRGAQFPRFKKPRVRSIVPITL